MTHHQQSPRTLPALLLAGLLTTMSSYGMAQSVPATPAAGAPANTAVHGRHDPAQMQAQMQARVNKRMAELKTQLKITPAQEAAWTSFTTALQPTQRTGGADMRAAHEELSKLPTPERLDRMRALHTQHMNEMTTRMNQRADATKTFYNVLNIEQKKTFDDAFNRAMSGRNGPHMMGGAEGMDRGMDGHRMSQHRDHRG